jgi:hypothetical protein
MIRERWFSGFAAGWKYRGEITMTTLDTTTPNIRKESDSLGEVDVPANVLWGAQTQRSLEHFSIGHDLIPREMIAAYATLKKAAANVNHAAGRLPDEQRRLIVQNRSTSKKRPHIPISTGTMTQFPSTSLRWPACSNLRRLAVRRLPSVRGMCFWQRITLVQVTSGVWSMTNPGNELT